MVKEFQADLGRYLALGSKKRQLITNPAVWAIFWYRFGHWVYKEAKPSLLLVPLKIIQVVGAIFLESFQQMRLNPGAEIGPGLLIAHSGGITLHYRAVIGRNCDLAHHVTIGTPGLGRDGVPRIGDSVYIGTGAVVIGDIQVGDGARIAANSLVTRDVPAGTTVMGVPAQVVRGPKPSLEGFLASAPTSSGSTK